MIPSRVKKCVTHHHACECLQYKFEKMESALKVIHTWVDFDINNDSLQRCLHPRHVRDLCKKALNCLTEGE